MEKLETLSRDLGFGPRGKSNPMRSSSSSSSIHHQPLGLGGDDLFHFSPHDLLPGRPTPPDSTNHKNESTSSSSFFDMPQSYMFPTSHGQVWLTVTEIPLSTQPTAAPAPSRPPPPVPHRASFSTSTKNADHIYSTYGQNQPLYEPEMENDTQGSDQMEIKERLEHDRKHKEEEREQRQEREKVRHAVESASRDARERAAAETRRQAERAAVDKANADARRRAERAAVQRVQAEARERAAAGAKERAEKAKAEAEAEAEARRRAERSAVDQERTAAELRERAATATATQMDQQKNDNDVEAFFMGQASSAPRTRADSTEPLFDQRFQNGGGSATVNRTPSSTGTSSSMKKASSTTNIVDDLSSLFGGASSPEEFQEFEGETEVRRKARLDSHQRTKERVDKVLAEKNQRDLQAQRDQEERHRISETLDFQIKRWAAGKEGNLRALLSTLQYVLWPECGWQPVSLTDLITGASVKKVYRKATLCIHPDKVQQKGASLQQKYIAEKVFDLLKEAWNKLNSEELF